MNTQGTERINEEDAVETKVETVDYRSPPGQEDPTIEKVGVVHLSRSKKDPGIMAKTASAVTNTFKSAKDAVVGKGKDNTTK